MQNVHKISIKRTWGNQLIKLVDVLLNDIMRKAKKKVKIF